MNGSINLNDSFHRVMLLLGIACLLALSATKALAARNLLDNGDFSHVASGVPLAWGLEQGASSVKAGPDGHPCLKIASEITQYCMATEFIPIDSSRVRKVRFCGMVRYQGVRRGVHEYDTLRAFIAWYDYRGRQVGDYADVGFLNGSSGWRSFGKVFEVPRGTTRAEVLIGLHECTGVCYFAKVALEVAAGDKSFSPGGFSKIDTRGWWPFTASETPAAGTPIDVSHLLDAPAGKHGFVTVRDAHFFFQDGVRARFWGFDIMGAECFPDHATADGLAARLARMGVNIVRLHHMDAWWAKPNIFDQRFNDTRHLSASSLDRLDYFLAKLKERGIYIYLDWLVNRKFKKGDGVADYKAISDGAKIVAHFDPRIIELEREYMRSLLSHKNAYTGVRYADEPQIALSEVINEDSLFYEDWYDPVPKHYLSELKSICRRYEPKADPTHHPFDGPTIRALYRIESGYYKEMRDYLRSIGMKCPTTGSNHWENIGPGLLCDSETDYIDRHYYWDHPKGGFGWWQDFDNQPMLTHFDEALLPDIGASKVAGKPMVVTEWCFCWANDYIAEGSLIGAATACLQDWDVMIWFDISSDAPNSAMENEFDMADKPHLFSQWAAAAMLFHRQDVSPLGPGRYREITRQELLRGKPLTEPPKEKDVQNGRIEVEIVDKPTSPPKEGVIPSSKQAVWDATSGTFIVQTDRTLALDGFLTDRKNCDYGWVRISVESPFCVLWVSSLDGLPLDRSKRLLVTAAARAQNTGAEFNPGRTRQLKQGKEPILVEAVRVTLEFADEVTIRPLAQNGKPGQAFKSRRLELSKGRTFWYEVDR